MLKATRKQWLNLVSNAPAMARESKYILSQLQVRFHLLSFKLPVATSIS